MESGTLYVLALVGQWIDREPPKLKIQVQFLSRAPRDSTLWCLTHGLRPVYGPAYKMKTTVLQIA